MARIKRVGSVAIYTSLKNPGEYRLVYPSKRLADGRDLQVVYPFRKEVGDGITKIVAKKYEELMYGEKSNG